MTIAAFSTAGFSQYIAASSNVTASQQAFQSLQQSLASGNLAQAQAAFNTYQQLNQSATAAATGSGSSSASTVAPSQFSTDLTALGKAIGSGNLTTAQSAFATLQGDLKNAPSQSLTNAESAVAQTVSWVDDLLNLNGNSQQDTTPVDPTTAILDSAYGLSSSSSNTAPTTSILENAYGTSGSGTSSGSSSPSSSASASARAGNPGSGASVNAYA
jgi:hypothetical protein